MSIQAQLEKHDPRLYSANRDVAHNFRFVVTEVGERLADNRWAEMESTFHTAPTPEQLGEAAKAFITFVASATQDPKANMHEMLERHGWFKLQPAAQVAYMATLGVVMSGIYFRGAREATLGGKGPCDDIDQLLATGREACMLISAPRWKRPWLRLREKLRQVRNVFKR